MKDDYLWDGSGEPDPEVQKLENLLGRYRHDQPAPAFDQLSEERHAPRWGFGSCRFSFQIVAVAAVLSVVVAAFLIIRARLANNKGPAWEFARICSVRRGGVR